MFGLVRGESVSVLLTAESVVVTVNVRPQCHAETSHGVHRVEWKVRVNSDVQW